MNLLQFGPTTVGFAGPAPFHEAFLRAFTAAPESASTAGIVVQASELSSSAAAEPDVEGGKGPFFHHDNTRVYLSERSITLWDGSSTACIPNDPAGRVDVWLHPDSLLDDRFERTFLYVLVSLALRRLGVFYVHAALVHLSEMSPVLVLGESGSGKSTTTLNLMRAGARWWSDDACLLWCDSDHRARLTGIARPFHLTSMTLAVMPEWRSHVRGIAANGKSIVDVASVRQPERTSLDSWVTLALTRTSDTPTALHTLDQASAFLALARACAWFGLYELGFTDEQQKVVLAACAQPAFELRAGPDVLDDPALLARVLRSHRETR